MCFKLPKIQLIFTLPLHATCHKVLFKMMNYSSMGNMLDFHTELIPFL